MVESKQARLDAVFAALADPTRRALIAALARRPRTVGKLATPFDLSFAAVSKHLAVLERAGLVVRERRGRSVECALVPARLRDTAVWFSHYQHFWDARLAALDAFVTRQRGRP